MKKRIGIFLAALLLLSSCGRDSGRLKMGAAGLGGTYQAFSDAFAKLESETNNREIEVRTTAGSAANLRLLSQNYIQLALCQADLLEDAWNGTGQFQGTEPIRGFGAVAGVYEEACQIVVRADSEISTVEELEGHRVSIGEEESGTKQNALQILAASERKAGGGSFPELHRGCEGAGKWHDRRIFLYGRSADGCNYESGAADRNPVPEC